VSQAVGLQRLEKATYCRCAALDRIKVETARWPRLAAHCPHQIFVHDPFIVHQHAIQHRIVIADDGVDEFGNKCIRFETELSTA
jgi:hypothetical protein